MGGAPETLRGGDMGREVWQLFSGFICRIQVSVRDAVKNVLADFAR